MNSWKIKIALIVFIGLIAQSYLYGQVHFPTVTDLHENDTIIATSNIFVERFHDSEIVSVVKNKNTYLAHIKSESVNGTLKLNMEQIGIIDTFISRLESKSLRYNEISIAGTFVRYRVEYKNNKISFESKEIYSLIKEILKYYQD